MKRTTVSALTMVTLSAKLAQAAPADRVPVLVELFTSEGCSSCPPADRVLTRLTSSQPVDGAEIVPLALHVDYWDRLGWKDPFSSGEATARQTRYAERFGGDRIYTPQMVVDGRAEFVGSQESRAEEEIARAARIAKGRLQLTVAPGRGSHVNVRVAVRELPALTPGDEAEVVLALTEDALATDVSRGENKGRHLDHSAVVRDLASLGRVKGAAFETAGSVEKPKGSRPDALHAVAFVQERGSRRVLAVATAAIP